MKGRIQPNRKKNSESAIQMKLYNKMIAVINFMNCSTSMLPNQRKRRHLLERNTAWHMQQETSQRHHISNKYDHQNLFLALPFII